MFPAFAEPLTEYAVRNYLNLFNTENLKKYHGPVKFIRRTQDEVMNIGGPTLVKSNLGNMLLENFLRSRYPLLFDAKTSIDHHGNDHQSNALLEWLSTSSQGVKGNK